MTNSQGLLIAAGVTVVLTSIGVGIAALLDRTLIPIIAAIGTTISAVLSHELVKTIIMKIVTYLTTPAVVQAASGSSNGLELRARLNRPHRTRTLTFSSHESRVDLNGRHVVSDIETKIEETVNGVTPPSSRDTTYVTATSGSSSDSDKSMHRALTVD